MVETLTHHKELWQATPITADQEYCPNCGHERRHHSRNGCMYVGGPTGKQCTCPTTYMDLR